MDWEEEPYEPEEEEEDWGLLEWVLLPFFLLWQYKYFVLIAVGAAIAAFGIFDKEKVAESRSCPGYALVRSLKAKRQINTFTAVKPEGNWECEYSLDNEDALIRFKRVRGEISSEVESRARGGSAYSAASREMRAEGYVVR